jgi:hypothetical protein
VDVDTVRFTGTPPFVVTFKGESEPDTVKRADAKLYYFGEKTIESFTDLTLAPGVILTQTPATQTLTASAAGYCAGSPGVQFALGGTEKAAVYQLYKDKDGSAELVATMNGTGNAATFTGNFPYAGSYTARVKATPAFYERAMNGTPTVVEYALPTVATTTSSLPICYNTAATLSVTATGGTTTNMTYTWNGCGLTNPSTTTEPTKPTGPLTATNNSYTVQILTENGCTVTSDPATITVYDNFSPGTITSKAQAICSKSAATVIASSAAASGGNNAYTYEWRYTGSSNGTITNSDTAAYTPPTASSYTTAGTYTFTRWVNDGKCQTSPVVSAGSMVMTVVDKPTKPAAAPTYTNKCAGTAVTFTTATVSGATGYDWAGSVTGTGSTKNTATTAGNYTAQSRAYVTVNGTSCYSDYSAGATATVYAMPTVTITSSSTNYLPTKKVKLTATVSNCASCAYTWSGSGVSPTNAQAATLTVPAYASSTNPTVTVTATGACKASANIGKVQAVFPAASNHNFVLSDSPWRLSQLISYRPDPNECTQVTDIAKWDATAEPKWYSRTMSKDPYTGLNLTISYYSPACHMKLINMICNDPWKTIWQGAYDHYMVSNSKNLNMPRAGELINGGYNWQTNCPNDGDCMTIFRCGDFSLWFSTSRIGGTSNSPMSQPAVCLRESE